MNPTTKEVRTALRAIKGEEQATVSVTRETDPACIGQDEYRLTLNNVAGASVDAVLEGLGLRRIGKGAHEIVGSRWNWRYVYVAYPVRPAAAQS